MHVKFYMQIFLFFGHFGFAWRLIRPEQTSAELIMCDFHKPLTTKSTMLDRPTISYLDSTIICLSTWSNQLTKWLDYHYCMFSQRRSHIVQCIAQSLLFITKKNMAFVENVFPGLLSKFSSNRLVRCCFMLLWEWQLRLSTS